VGVERERTGGECESFPAVINNNWNNVSSMYSTMYPCGQSWAGGISMPGL
jgi:hypothetical protein